MGKSVKEQLANNNDIRISIHLNPYDDDSVLVEVRKGNKGTKFGFLISEIESRNVEVLYLIFEKIVTEVFVEGVLEKEEQE